MLQYTPNDLLSRKHTGLIYQNVVDSYKNSYGIDLSDVQFSLSKIPRYNTGKRNTKFNRLLYGGCWTDKGKIYLNTRLPATVNHYTGKSLISEDDVSNVIAHELAHEIYRKRAGRDLKKKVARKVKQERFTTDYLNSLSRDHKNYEEEAFCEYLASTLKRRKSNAPTKV